jgi:integrase-like protein
MDDLRLDEIRRHIDACDDVYRPLAETLIATGLRISEALALTWDDIDCPARRLRLLRSRKPEGPGSTKGDRFRSVDFGARLEAVLRSRRDDGAPPSGRTLVFRGPRGGELSRSDVSRDMHKHASRTPRCAGRCACTTYATRWPPPGWPRGCRCSTSSASSGTHRSRHPERLRTPRGVVSARRRGPGGAVDLGACGRIGRRGCSHARSDAFARLLHAHCQDREKPKSP